MGRNKPSISPLILDIVHVLLKKNIVNLIITLEL